jgi:hypothetical protein
MHYDPYNMTPLDPDEFRLMFWEINKSELKLPARQSNDRSLKALTVVGTSVQERRQIKEWCRNHGNIRVFRTKNWEDKYGNGAVSLSYINHEFPILAYKDDIDQLIDWAGTLPRRKAAVLVNGLSRREIGCRLKGKIHKIIPVLGGYPNRNVVSVCDEHLEFELALRSD